MHVAPTSVKASKFTVESFDDYYFCMTKCSKNISFTMTFDDFIYV